MATEKQIAANKANAQKSTGPKSEEGKASSSKNAVKHGVLSKVSVADHEDEALFASMLEGLIQEHAPHSTIESQLIERLAVLFWREIRLAKAEAFETKANLSNFEYEKVKEENSSSAFRKNMLPKHYRTLANILPIETQLLVGRYQTMLSNQIMQTLKQLREEQKLREQVIEVAPKVTRIEK
jgi:hypothetical protein